MIESIMYFAIGFFAAGLSVLIIVPLVHGRAVRLTTRRLEAALPASMAEVVADKDVLRADFAMSTRRLEFKIEQLTTNSASQLAELGRKSDALNRLKIECDALREQLRVSGASAAIKVDAERALVEKESELTRLDERTAIVDSQNAEIATLTSQVQTLHGQLAQASEEAQAAKDRAAAARDVKRALAEKETELAKLTSTLDERALLVDSQNAEIAALTRQMQTLHEQLAQAGEAARAAEDRAAAVRDVERALAERQSEVAALTRTLDQQAMLVDSQTAEMGALTERIQTLKKQLAQVGEQARAAEVSRAVERSELAAATDQLMEERAKFADFHGRVTELVQRLSAQTAKDKLAARQTQEDFQARVVEQSRLLEDHERELKALRKEIAIARQREADLQITAENFGTESSRLQAMLERANGERTRLTYELTALRRRVENTQAA
jgi:septation ring formation regulator EzrA